MCNVFQSVYKVETLHCNVFTGVYNVVKSVYKVETLHYNVFINIVGVVKSIVGVVRNDSLGAKKKNSLTKS